MFDRNRFKNRLQERTKEIADQGSGVSFKTIFIPQFPEDIGSYRPKAGKHTVDVVPYNAGEFDPNTKPGDPTYILTVWVHYGIGPNNDTYICMARTYNKPCAVCDYIKEKGKADLPAQNKEALKRMKPKQRAIYYVLVYDTPEEERKGLQVWNAPHWKMQRFLNELSVQPERGGVKVGGYISFADPDTGKTIGFKIEGEGESTDYLGHRFIDRNYAIPDEVLEKASRHPLDSMLHVPEYQEVQDALAGFNLGPVKETATQPQQQPLVGADSQPPAQPETPAQPADAPQSESEAGAPSEYTCPGGGEFGEDIEQLAACADCQIFDACDAENKKRIETRRKNRQLKRQQA